MKHNLKLLIIFLFLVSCGMKEDNYEIEQEIYSEQGIDLVKTTVFWRGKYDPSLMVYTEKQYIYDSSDSLKLLDKKKQEAKQFIEKHKDLINN